MAQTGPNWQSKTKPKPKPKPKPSPTWLKWTQASFNYFSDLVDTPFFSTFGMSRHIYQSNWWHFPIWTVINGVMVVIRGNHSKWGGRLAQVCGYQMLTNAKGLNDICGGVLVLLVKIKTRKRLGIPTCYYAKLVSGILAKPSFFSGGQAGEGSEGWIMVGGALFVRGRLCQKWSPRGRRLPLCPQNFPGKD